MISSAPKISPMVEAFKTTAPLAASPGPGHTYTSEIIVFSDVGYAQVQTEVLSDTDGTLTFTFYSDKAGSDTIRTLSIPYLASEGYRQFGAPTFGVAVRYSFENTTNSAQTDFFFSTKLLRQAVSPQVLSVDATISSSMMTTLQRSVIAGADTQGNYDNVSLDDNGNLEVAIRSPVGPFGSVLTTQLTPIVQAKWVNGLDDRRDDVIGHESGTVTASNGNIVLSTGTTTSSHAQFLSRDIALYAPGQGNVVRITPQYTSGIANTQQLAGAGDAENGYFFGYNGEDFGVLRRSGGQAEIRTLTITAGTTGTGNVTITLEGEAAVVALTSGLTIGEVVGLIAAADYADIGHGWRAHYGGDRVVFLAIDTQTRSGSYSFVDTDTTGAAGSIAQTVAASAPTTEEWTLATAWNRDKADGTATLPNIDFTKGSPYAIYYQWLGYGPTFYYIENPNTGQFVLVHLASYGNQNTVPSLRNPDLHLCLEVDNGATTSDVTIRAASAAIFRAGPPLEIRGLPGSKANEKNIGSTTTNILVIRVKDVYNGATNRVQVAVDTLLYTNNSSNRAAVFTVTRNPTLVGSPSWTGYGSSSVVEYDTATTAIVAGTGEVLRPDGISAAGGDTKELRGNKVILLRPGDILVVDGVLSGGSASDLDAGFGWQELF